MIVSLPPSPCIVLAAKADDWLSVSAVAVPATTVPPVNSVPSIVQPKASIRY